MVVVVLWWWWERRKVEAKWPRPQRRISEASQFYDIFRLIPSVTSIIDIGNDQKGSVDISCLFVCLRLDQLVGLHCGKLTLVGVDVGES